MTDVRLETSLQIAYFLPHADSFWRWSNDGESVVWRSDGRTIAFRGEIFTLLRRLAPHAVPPLGALILLLAATRETWTDPNEVVDRILASYNARGPIILTVVLHKVRQEVAGVVDDLAAVADLPEHLRQTTFGRYALADFVFSVSKPSMDEAAGERLLRLLDEGFDPDLLKQNVGHDNDFSRLLAEVDALRPGLARVAAEPLMNWARTGLEQPVEPARDIEIPAARRVRALLRDLMSDPQLAGIARLARDVLAAVHVPRALAAPEEIPVGGVSDISNRGPLDRLLVSELAHDDLTLAVRVALNEALYLRRESPTKHPPFSRAVLIDVGIRMWGIPRLFAAAVGLALAAGSDERAAVQTFRTAGKNARPVELTSREGLTALLEALEPDPHPAASLNEYVISTGNDQHEVERFIITHEAAFADNEFLTALRAAGSDHDVDWYVATVAGDGTFVLWRTSASGREELCRAVLSLDDIAPEDAAKTSTAATSRLRARDPNLPLILFVEPFPLLLPAQIVPRHAAVSERIGLVAVTHDRRLMRWTRDTAGGQQLHAGLPPGRIEGVFADESRNAVHVVVARHKKNAIDVLAFDLASGQCDHREYARNHPRRVFFHGGAICLGYANEVRVISPDNGAERLVKLPEGAGWCANGRFLRRWHIVEAFAQDGLYQVGESPSFAEPFDRTATGPCYLRNNGTIMTADGTALIAPERPTDARFRLLASSPDGNRILASVGAGPRSGVYSLILSDGAKAAWKPVPAPFDDPHGHTALLGSAYNWAYPFPVRHRFAGIFRDEDGMLTLSTCEGGAPLSIRPAANGELRLRAHTSPAHNRIGPELRPFRAVPPSPGLASIRYGLSVAAWPDGSRALIDSRGLLHLISSDRKLPQLTLVLTDQPLAGWTSDGRTFGWAYFLPEKATDTPALGTALIREFAERVK